MKSLPWDSGAVIRQIRDRIWLYLSPSSSPQKLALDASTLLQMDPVELIALSRVYFVASDEVGEMLDEVPALLRRLPTTSEYEEEWSTERIRGAIKWPATLAARNASAQPHLFVTQPVTRAFQTPENELLTFMLRAIKAAGESSGWSNSRSDLVGTLVSSRTLEATRLSQNRMLRDVLSKEPSDRSLSRIRTGRHKRRFGCVLDAFDVYRRLLSHLDRTALQETIENRGLLTRTAPVLFELLCLFKLLDALVETGWTIPPLRLIPGKKAIVAKRAGQELDIWYQGAPESLRSGSEYVGIQKDHGFLNSSDLIPDIVLRHRTAGETRWLMVESKMGTKRPVERSARAALLDLLAYEKAFEHGLAYCDGTIGLGVAWGNGLEPVASRHMLCTPDTLTKALSLFTS